VAVSEKKALYRFRFHANAEDPRPLKWPILHPYWVTGYHGGGWYSVIVAYANDLAYIYELWPEADEIQVEQVDDYFFNDRFPKPDWFEVEEA
jgi:hypothetical protein